MTVRDIKTYLIGLGFLVDVYGDEEKEVEGFCSIREPKDHSLSFVRDERTIDMSLIQSNMTLVVICPKKLDAQFIQICVDNPHRAFFKVIEFFFCQRQSTVNMPEKSVVLSSHIGEGFNVGPFSFIDQKVTIGNNCRIGSHVSIEGSVQIGDHVIIESGVRIGTWGYGHYLNEDRTNTMIPHLGGVRIGNDCFIGANTVISRGTLTDTVIGDYVKIDALCYIAHNAVVKDRVMIAGGAGVAGSATIEEDVWISPRCVINAGIKVGKNSFIGINAIVTKDIPDNKYAMGIPAEIIKDNQDVRYKI